MTAARIPRNLIGLLVDWITRLVAGGHISMAREPSICTLMFPMYSHVSKNIGVMIS